jgi:hypothetical protein
VVVVVVEHYRPQVEHPRPRLDCAWLLQDGLLHVLLSSRWYLLLKVEGNMGGSASSSMAMAMTTTTASGHGGRGVMVQAF